MKPMKIGFDLDDTIADHTFNIVKLAKEYGISTSSLTLPKKFSIPKILSKEQYHGFKERLYGEVSLTAIPMEDSQDVMRDLHKDGMEVFIISRRLLSREYALQWLAKHFPLLREECVHFVNKDIEKGPICAELGIKIFLDNKPEVLEHIPKTTIPILFDRFDAYKEFPWKRVSSWREFHELCKTQREEQHINS